LIGLIIHVVGLNLKGGLLADKPKKKRKASVLVLSHKEEEEEEEEKEAAATTMDTTSPCEPKASPDKFEKIERKSK
jgi:hypothetical protein